MTDDKEIVRRLRETAPMFPIDGEAADIIESMQSRIDDALRLEHKPGASKRDIIAALKGTDR